MAERNSRFPHINSHRTASERNRLRRILSHQGFLKTRRRSDFVAQPKREISIASVGDANISFAN